MFFGNFTHRLRSVVGFTALAVAIAASLAPAAKAAVESRLPERAKLYFIQDKPIFVGDSNVQRREGREFLRATRSDAPDRQLIAALGRAEDGSLRLDYTDWKGGNMESQGYMVFGAITRHNVLGEGRTGVLVQTHQRVDGRLVPKLESAKVFMQFSGRSSRVTTPNPRSVPPRTPSLTPPPRSSQPPRPAPQPEPAIEPEGFASQPGPSSAGPDLRGPQSMPSLPPAVLP